MIFKKKKKECKYTSGNYKCSRSALEGDEHCIFHSENIEGKKDKFNSEFWKEFKKHQKKKEIYDFTGFVFPGDIDFSGKIFEENVSFSMAKFHGKTFFPDTTFKEAAIFEGAEFKDVNPNNETGSAEAMPRQRDINVNSTPLEVVNAAYGKSSYADFGGAHFLKSVNFLGVVFPRYANFINTVFDEKAIFWGTKFLGNVNFSETIFNGEVNFLYAHFCLLANAGEKSVYFKVDFENAQFSGRVSFVFANFYGNAEFRVTKFEGITNFFSSTFFNEVEFNATKFTGGAIFNRTKFLGKTTFNVVDFNHERADFENIVIGDNAHIKMINTYFYDVFGLFKSIDENRGKLPKQKKPKLEFLPENFRLTLGEKATASHPVISRKIKDDMYLLKFQKIHPHVYKIWQTFADCGRGLLRWVGWCLGVAFIFSWIFYGYYLHSPSSFQTVYVSEGCPFFSFFYYSVVTFTTLGFGDIVPKCGWLQLWVMLEVIAGYIMLGFLISIGANKFARRS